MEFLENLLGDYLRQQGIRHHTSYTYTPQQNGLTERKNRNIMEVVRASLFGMNMPRFYWGEAVKYVVYLINRVPFRSIGFQPHTKNYKLFLTYPINQTWNPNPSIVLYMFTYPKSYVLNLILVPHIVYLLVIPIFRKGTCTMTLKLTNSMFLLISPFVKLNPIIQLVT